MIKYAKVRDVTSPRRGSGDTNDRSAGVDFFVPNYSKMFEDVLRKKNAHIHLMPAAHVPSGVGGTILTNPSIIIDPHSHVLIPSGICCNLQSSNNYLYDDKQGLAFIAFNKSSIGIKQLDVAAMVIDESYQGEIHISLVNTSANRVEIFYGEKIIQFAIVPVLMDALEEFDHASLFPIQSKRGTNGFGSTGSK